MPLVESPIQAVAEVLEALHSLAYDEPVAVCLNHWMTQGSESPCA